MKVEQKKVIDKNKILALKKETGLNEIVLELLCIRGIDEVDKISSFFDCKLENLSSPYEIKDMDKAVEFVKNAVKNQKKILIYGDYDCDGVTSTAILRKYFNSINYKVDYYLPDRELEGYGLSETCISNFMNMYHPEVVITVDCGSGNVHEVELLKSKYNVDVLVTDHHEIGEILPDCIVINPKTSENNLRNLAGCGVALKLVEALSSRDYSKTLLDICAIGTIADLVDLTGDNRIIVKLGIELLNENKIPGIKILKNQIRKPNDLTEGDIGFSIAPMINSIGRMENANQVVDLFLSNDYYYLQNMALKLEKLNNERKFLCDSMYDDALRMLKDYDFITNKVIILYSNHWKTGVLGIVASRIAEEYHLPVILFGDNGDSIKGSARTAGGINLYELLSYAKEYYLSFGGHSGAAGLSLKKENLNKVLPLLNEYITNNSLTKKLFPNLTYDVEISKISKDLYEDIKLLAPFGMGNPTPKFLIKSDGGFVSFAGKHIKAEKDGYELISFNQIDNLANFNEKTNLLVKLSENTFNGITKYQGIIEKLAPTGHVEDSINYLLDYYKSLLYKENKIDIEYIDDYSSILNQIDDIFGTIFICFSRKTFETLNNVILKLPKYKNKFFTYDIKNRGSIPPYNRVVLSPSRSYDFTGYKNIVFIEEPMKLIYTNNIEKAYVVRNNEPFVDEIKSLNLTRETLGNIYQTLKLAVLSRDRGTCIEDWYFILKNKYNLENSMLEFSLAFYIFYELGFFTIDHTFRLTLTNVKKPLDESLIFCNLERVKDV